MGATRRRRKHSERSAIDRLSGAGRTAGTAATSAARALGRLAAFPVKVIRCAVRLVTAPVRAALQWRSRRSESKAAKAARLAGERFARMAPWEQDEVNRTRRRLSR